MQLTAHLRRIRRTQTLDRYARRIASLVTQSARALRFRDLNFIIELAVDRLSYFAIDQDCDAVLAEANRAIITTSISHQS